MLMRRSWNFRDAQQAALGFLIGQTQIIEQQVYRIQYPDILYPTLVPVVTDGDEWARSITFFSMDKTGKADWFHHQAQDIPTADISASQFEVGVEMAAIGYSYTLQELQVAQRTPWINLQSDRAEAALRAYEEFVDDVAIRGAADKGWTGLINDASVSKTALPADGTGSSALWSAKDEELITRDFNAGLTGMWTATNTLELADTVLLPIDAMTMLAQKRLANTNTTLLQWVQANNIYTQQTGIPITIRGVRGLETAGDGSVGRMVIYRRDPAVVRLHLPMPHRFLPIWQRTPLMFDVPGIFRLGGVEVRRPGAIRYLDGMLPAPTP